MPDNGEKEDNKIQKNAFFYLSLKCGKEKKIDIWKRTKVKDESAAVIQNMLHYWPISTCKEYKKKQKRKKKTVGNWLSI